MSVAVIGGGLIGLACAERLAASGAQVVLYDAAAEAREASWAAAGMLAPHHEWTTDTPLWRLGCASLTRWPSWLSDLALTAQQVDFREDGSWIPAFDAAECEEIAAHEQFLTRVGIACERVSGAALRQAEPRFASALGEALAVPGGQVNPRLLATCLRQRCAARAVELRYNCPVERLDGTTVVTSSGAQTFAQVVLASGAWTPHLAGLSGVQLAGEPVKGQLLRLAAPDDTLSRFVHCRHAYLVPRRGEGLVVGATMVHSGFDKAEDQAAIAGLAASARRLLPALQDAPILETWTGLRPRLASGLPCLATVRPGLTVATGHFRNGVLLTPITADAVAALVLNRPPPIDLTPFHH